MTRITSAICACFDLTISLNNKEQAWLHVNERCRHAQGACTKTSSKYESTHMKLYETVVPFRASSSSSTSSNWALSMLLTLQGFIIPMSLEKCLGWWLLCVFQPAFTSGAETASRRSIISSGWQALQRSLRLLLRSWRAKAASTKKKMVRQNDKPIKKGSILCKWLEAKRFAILKTSVRLWETFATRKALLTAKKNPS